MTFCLSRIMSATFACRSSFGCVWHTRELNLYLTLPFPTLIIDYFLLKFPPQSRLLNFFCDKINKQGVLRRCQLESWSEVRKELKIYAISFNSRQQHKSQINRSKKKCVLLVCPHRLDVHQIATPLSFMPIPFVLPNPTGSRPISQFSLLHIGNFVNHK